MVSLYESYLSNSRKDLISKYNHYQNLHQVTSIENLDLSFLKLRSSSQVIMCLGFLYLLIYKKGRVLAFSRKKFSKSLGCDVRLNKKEAFIFLQNFGSLNLENILDLEDGFDKSSFSKKGTFSFNIKDIFSFVQLGDDLFKFKDLRDLQVSIIFSKFNIKENQSLFKSLGFKYKSNV